MIRVFAVLLILLICGCDKECERNRRSVLPAEVKDFSEKVNKHLKAICLGSMGELKYNELDKVIYGNKDRLIRLSCISNWQEQLCGADLSSITNAYLYRRIFANLENQEQNISYLFGQETLRAASGYIAWIEWINWVEKEIERLKKFPHKSKRLPPAGLSSYFEDKGMRGVYESLCEFREMRLRMLERSFLAEESRGVLDHEEAESVRKIFKQFVGRSIGAEKKMSTRK